MKSELAFASLPCTCQMSATYVYCLIAASRIPALDRVPAGLPGTGPVRLLDVSGDDPTASTRTVRLRTRRRAAGPAPKQWLAVADAPLPQYGDASINRHLSDLDWVSRAAIAHEAVVESFIDAPAVLPMKLFTIFTNDERALEHLRRDRRRIAGLSEARRRAPRVGRARRARSGVPASGETAHRVGAPAAPGVAYLALKKAQRDRGERARPACANDGRGSVRSTAGSCVGVEAQSGDASCPPRADRCCSMPRFWCRARDRRRSGRWSGVSRKRSPRTATD